MGKSLKGKELGTGIAQRKDGLYQARFINRFGKRQTIYDKSYNQIQKRLREEQFFDAKQLNVADTDMTLDDWFSEWLEICKRNCRDTTKRTYMIQYNRLRDSLGWRKLSQLNLVIIQKAFNELKTDTSRRDCKAVLVDMLNRAVESDLISKNPAITVNTKLDNVSREEKRVLLEDEIETLYTVSKNGRLYPFFVLALNTGMRLGEILGLTWDCIDFENGLIKVRKTLCYLPNGGDAIYEFHLPKTQAGKRNIPMTKSVREVLLEQKNWKEETASRFEPRAGMENLVFVSKTNQPIHESNIRAAIRYMVNKITVEIDPGFAMFTPHSLRHTFATRCIANGMKPKTLQKILGHNSLQMTMDLYCHVLDDTVRDEMALFNEMV